MKPNKSKYILITLGTLILLTSLAYSILFLSLTETRKQQSRKTNTTHKYCSTPNVQELYVERNLEDKHLVNMRFRRIDKNLSKVSKKLLSWRAKWNFTQPSLGEANPRYIEHIVSSFCSIPKAILLAGDKVKEGNQDYSIKIVAKEALDSKDSTRQISFSLGKDIPGRKMLVKIEKEGFEPSFILMPNKVKKILQYRIDFFQNHRLVEMLLGSIEFAKVTINKKEKYFVERNGSDWSVTIKNKLMGKSKYKAEELVNRLATMQAMDVVKANINPKDCLKMNSYMKIQLEGIRKKKETLYFAKPNPKKEKIIACSTKRTSLFHVHKDIFSYILVNPKILLN